MKKIFNRAEVLEIINSGCVKAILDYDLQYADLQGANLQGANLHGANLRGADLHGANLRSADLQYADLHGADLRSADLQGANLKNADLRRANLRGANLRGADLDYSCLPLSCGGLNWKVDKRIACQLAYHLCSMKCDDEEFIKVRNSMLDFANHFHGIDEYGKLEIREVVNEK